MNQVKPILILLTLLALVLLPLQAVQAAGLAEKMPDGGVVLGTSYVLRDGETVNDGLIVIGGSALLESGSAFFGDLVVIGGSVTIQQGAELDGEVVTIGGSLTIDAEIRGDVVVIGGPALLQSDAHIRGDLVTIGGPIQKDEGARIDGELIDNPTPPTRPADPDMPVFIPGRSDFNVNPFWEAFWLFARSIGYGFVAALVVLFLPQYTRRVSDVIVRQPLLSAGMGILTYILFVVVIVALGLFSVLIITLILTVPLIVVVSLLLGAGMAFGWIALGTEVGVRLIGMFNREWPLPLSAALGTFLLTLVADGARFVPCVGWSIPFTLTLISLGAVAMSRFGTQSPPMTATQDEAGYVPPAETL
jgi:hypothetical protein